MSSKLETSKASGAHHQLSRLVGEWKGTAKVWFDPAKLEDESPVSGTMRPILDGRFILHEYKGSFGGKPLEGVAIIGYHLDLQRYECAWVDSFHTAGAIIFSEGQKASAHLNVLGKYAYVTPETEQWWGWRTAIEMPSDGEVIITAYNVSPEGEETKATETLYRRIGQ